MQGRTALLPRHSKKILENIKHSNDGGTDPDNAAGDRPSMLPDSSDGHDSDDMGNRSSATLGIAVKFSAKLSNVCYCARPGERNGQRG